MSFWQAATNEDTMEYDHETLEIVAKMFKRMLQRCKLTGWLKKTIFHITCFEIVVWFGLILNLLVNNSLSQKKTVDNSDWRTKIVWD